MEKQFVFARLEEDISWVIEFGYPVLCYTIKPPALLHDLITYVEIPDSHLREDGAYFYHLINKYNELADYTLFMQGRISDHSPNTGLFSGKFDFKFLTEVLLQDLDGRMYECALVKDVYRSIFGEDFTDAPEFEFGRGAMFMVSREIIQRKSQDFYQKFYEILFKFQSPHPKMVTAGYMERYWKYLFLNNWSIDDQGLCRRYI